MPTQEIENLLDYAFKPLRDKLNQDQQLLREYYYSGLPLGKFALSKNVNMDQLLWLLHKYGLPRRFRPAYSTDRVIAHVQKDG